MGWLFMPFTSMGGHKTAKSYLDAQLTCELEVDGTLRGQRVLASSCPGNRVYYAAAQTLRDGVAGEVFAVVCLVRWNPRSKDGHQFGYKDMSENMGPHEADCPAHILELLSPTANDYARDWRARCRANLAARSRKLADGDRILFPAPITFTDGHEAQEFVVCKRGRSIVLLDPQNGCFYRISRLMARPWSIVPVTRVHKTVFA
ncbi:DUF6927 domain-containing protein [Sphingobium algorifonticola]|jgi:hypothetical protein|uniref:DUF6927 domain-containing protein n=1 Tax=Sphingobium algorifonticola TaxID=2008318 RepID=A0A437J2C2_9SPHN|nr:hypothetical protein [Sphingobium algorifonticola]RVT38266.1 hypothetical protein ENE74_17840 [Sphingobium algorifonticola]